MLSPNRSIDDFLAKIIAALWPETAFLKKDKWVNKEGLGGIKSNLTKAEIVSWDRLSQAVGLKCNLA